ncbi:MAG: alginate lyase family protein, partial [Cellvibrionales bacterium]|nr:alginate lyase family protein [Cellvibrionales bacterium]
DRIYGFAKVLAINTDTALDSPLSGERTAALNCIHQGLLAWAKADALLGVEASKTGVAYRKWFLSSITSSLLKLRAAYSDVEISMDILIWISRLSETVLNDYQYRLETRQDLINNHDYWAAHAIMNSGMLTGNYAAMGYVERLFRFAMSEVSGKRKVGYFDNELARGDLAEDYMNFSMAPLMLIGEFLYLNEVNLDDEIIDLQSLALFNLRLALDRKQTQKLVTGNQKFFSKNKLIWTLPYIHLFGVNDSTAKKIINNDMVFTDYFMIGGDLASFYPHQDWIDTNFKGIFTKGRNKKAKNVNSFIEDKVAETISNATVTSFAFYEKALSKFYGRIDLNQAETSVPHPDDNSTSCGLWTASEAIFDTAKLALIEDLAVDITYISSYNDNPSECLIQSMTIR